jgi:pilus assembly protein FimV
MAAAETFDRYGIDRPFFLQDIQFNIVRSGRSDGNVVQVRSAAPMAEPFITFLVEASWSRGRLLREYTVFLDPPTFAPPVADTAPAVQAPVRAEPTDSGRIERAAPPPQQAQPAPAPRQPAPAPRQPAPEPQQQQPAPQPAQEDIQFDTTAGGDLIVGRGDTLWGVASRVRPDSRLTMNQTMLAIFEANPEAFGGNINILRAGASLRIPSADDVFRISRGDAFAEAQRQHAEWTGGTLPTPTPVEDTTTRPSLTLVPPDDDFVEDPDTTAPDPIFDDEPTARETEIEQRIAELEAADVPQQQSLIEIRDNELAQLREELARIRGEAYEPPIDETTDDVTTDVDEIVADDVDAAADDAEPVEDTEPAVEDAPPPTDIIRTPTRSEPSLVDRAIEMFTSIWAIIAGALVVVAGALFWFMRRGCDDDDDPDSWQPLDSDETGGKDLSATESLRAPVMDESIVVVEQDAVSSPDIEQLAAIEKTVEAPVFEVADAGETTEVTGDFGSLEDTFSSETAINLDQSDPIAEADFHMAYGLYDQAADLVNGALSVEPERTDLLTKLCEIYFVWGNRDAFVDAAGRLHTAVGEEESADWDKIVIMGQQIAAEDALFAGASAAGATKAVDLAFEAGMDETGALDMELIGDEAGSDDIVDLGADEETQALETEGEVDFFVDSVAEEPDVEDIGTEIAEDTEGGVDFEVTQEMPSVDETAEMPTPESTVETPTIEQQFDVISGTSELPSLDEAVGEAIEDSGQSAEETAEINLDDLDFDVDGLAETELASLDDIDETSKNEALSDTGISEALGELADVTGKNPEVDPDATGVQTAFGTDDTGEIPVVEATGMNAALASEDLEETEIATDVGIEENLLDATGVTQVLSGDMAVDTGVHSAPEISDEDATMLAPGYGDDDAEAEADLPDDAETMLASLDDDDDAADFDFAKTEALPKDAFSGEIGVDETGEMPAIASTDVDLDLDDLTAALKISEVGDTVEQPRDDATVEQPRPNVRDYEGTVSLSPDDMSDDLSDARTMTEVGTKLDLARAYVDMGDPSGARSILEEVLDEGDEGQRQQAQQLLDSLPS